MISYSGNQTKLERKLGGGQFYLPHGIYVDKDGFVYTTDVGSHTVAKWKIEGNELKNIWTSGELLMPGSDQHHYCKPTGKFYSMLIIQFASNYISRNHES